MKILPTNSEMDTGSLMTWLRAWFAVPLRILAVLVTIFQFNRAWLARILARKSAAGSLKGIIFVTIVVWFAIWLFAGDEHRGRLSQTIQSFWSGLAK